MLTILLCKLLCFVGGLIGKGSSLPGAICLKLNKRALRRLKLPKTVIAVTGSNGKTTTTALLCAVAEGAGKKVLCNREGSNQKEGIATLLLKNANPFTRRVNADMLILESDERFCQYTFKDVVPSHIVITNLFRDQLTRNGHPEFVKGELAKGLPEQSVLILNANEPTSCSFGKDRENSIYYGVSAEKLFEKDGAFMAYDDGAYCPVCRKKMTYSYRIAGQVGSFACRSCGFHSPVCAHSVTDMDDEGRFVLDGEYAVSAQLRNTAFAQNIAAAFTAAVEAMGIPAEQAAQLLDAVAPQNGRLVEIKVNECDGLFMLCKHENSMAYNGAIRTAVEGDEQEKTVVIIVDRLSRKYTANDMSWLWDIDFERLVDDKVKKIILSGGFAHDLAVRFIMGGIDEAVLDICPDLDDMMEHLWQNAVGRVYVMTCFTDQYKFLNRLARKQKQVAAEEEKARKAAQRAEQARRRAAERAAAAAERAARRAAKNAALDVLNVSVEGEAGEVLDGEELSAEAGDSVVTETTDTAEASDNTAADESVESADETAVDNSVDTEVTDTASETTEPEQSEEAQA